MKHSIHRVQAVEIVGPYLLRVGFEDGTEQVIDFEPILFGEMYEPLRDIRVFESVRIDPETRTLVWPNGGDFDPATLHDWPANEVAFREMARGWATVRT